MLLCLNQVLAHPCLTFRGILSILQMSLKQSRLKYTSMKTKLTLPAHDSDQPPSLITLLSHGLRWRLLKALAHSDYQVSELVDQLQAPMNLVSYHLKLMRDSGLLAARRSEADGREIYYSLALDHLHQMYVEAGAALHPSLIVPRSEGYSVTRRRVLFVCTHNSARSQMGEGLLRHLSHEQLEVHSAGTMPTALHPDAVNTMRQLGIDISQQQSRSLNEFIHQRFDFVITVCDKARETCPTFPGEAVHMHWGLPDPAAVKDPTERAEVFAWTAQQLQQRIQHFLNAIASQPK